jgi:hypothetical protein
MGGAACDKGTAGAATLLAHGLDVCQACCGCAGSGPGAGSQLVLCAMYRHLCSMHCSHLVTGLHGYIAVTTAAATHPAWACGML